jgi:hypothetical protein
MLGLNFKPVGSTSEECDSVDTIRLSHENKKNKFIILYKYYLLRISKWKTNFRS